MNHKNHRCQDVVCVNNDYFLIEVDGYNIRALTGESVLSAMSASNIKILMRNDYGIISGAYCVMGICYLCLVCINGKYKQKACQTIVKPAMKIKTQCNKIKDWY